MIFGVQFDVADLPFRKLTADPPLELLCNDQTVLCNRRLMYAMFFEASLGY